MKLVCFNLDIRFNFLGFRSAFGAGHVLRLSEMCVMKLQENVDAITDTRGLDFDVLEPVLERAKPETLMLIEDYNSYLTEYTGLKDKLWHLLYDIASRYFGFIGRVSIGTNFGQIFLDAMLLN